MKTIRITLLLSLALIACACAWIWLPSQITVETSGRDFAGYWASGRLLLEGDNPYSAEKVLALQRSLGWADENPLVVYNPPWVLTLLLPFSNPSFAPAKAAWLGCILFLILFCADRLWVIYGGSRETRIRAPLIAATFSPVLFATLLGQIVPFMLLGLVGFLYFVRRRKWWAAGMMTALVAVKPHAVYLFWPALLLWALKDRLWPVLLGSALSLLCLTGIALWQNPYVIHQYFGEIVSHSYACHWATPTLGTYLRACFGFQECWLQYIPVPAGLIWFIFYWRRHGGRWIWENRVPMIIFISLITNFYAWPSDYLMMLPAVILATVWMIHHPETRQSRWGFALYAAINAIAFVSMFFLSYQWYYWMPFALFAHYSLVINEMDSKDAGEGHGERPSKQA